MTDPSVWYPVNALIDGIDVGSNLPQDRLKYLVYRRRLFIETLKTKTMFMMQIDPSKGAASARMYVEMSMPVDKKDLERVERDKQRQIDEVEKMEPISIKNVRFGESLNAPFIKESTK